MIERKNVQNSSIEFKELIVDVDTVYVNFNESKIFDEDKKHIGWRYDQFQYDKNEYMELISKENEELKDKLQASVSANRANILALIEVNSRLNKIEKGVK